MRIYAALTGAENQFQARLARRIFLNRHRFRTFLHFFPEQCKGQGYLIRAGGTSDSQPVTFTQFYVTFPRGYLIRAGGTSDSQPVTFDSQYVTFTPFCPTFSTLFSTFLPLARRRWLAPRVCPRIGLNGTVFGRNSTGNLRPGRLPILSL